MAKSEKLRGDETDAMLIQTDWDWPDYAGHIGCTEIDRIVEQVSDYLDDTVNDCDEYL